ncbi:winged helix-turn-helix transcriptional regulator [Sporofaciens musculi]
MKSLRISCQLFYTTSEYSLTERGKSLIPILDGMCEWGDKNRLP